VICSVCGAEAPSGARFCPSCGHELARRADQRRIVTVLFADIVGFTGLSETRDPEQVKNMVDRCFGRLADDITEFGGRVDKVIGDAIVALFGAPVSHEDDAERAVRAALRMQETVKRFDAESRAGIRLRIGVNTGEALVGGLVAGDNYTAMGDAVNVASRLQAAADPGTVLVGEATHAETAGVIRYGSEGHCHIRGREEPIHTWRALEPIGQPGKRRDPGVIRLVGREPEMALLRRATAASFRRGRAQLLVVQGETGVGKSRMAGELVELAGLDNDMVVISGRCLPYGEANVWWPLAEAVRGLAEGELDSEETDARPAVTAMVVDLLGNDDTRSEDDLDEDEAKVPPTVEGVLHLLGYPSRLDELDPIRADEESARAVRVLLYRMAERTPLLLWLADLHWADALLLRFVDDTLDRLRHRPFVLLATAQTDLADRWADRSSRYDTLTVTLEPLDDESAGRLIDELLGVETDPDLRRAILARAGGNPLFLHEIARMVRDGGDGVTVPANINSVIGARLDALDADVQSVLEDAASLGSRGLVSGLEQMARETRGDGRIQPALARLGAEGLLELEDGRWAFRSSLIRDVAYSRLTKTERAHRHAGIAEAIEQTGRFPDAVAYHYRTAARLDRELGGVHGLPRSLTDRAIDWTVRAVGARVGSRASDHVRRLYSEALDLLDYDDPRRAGLLMDRARGHLNALRIDEAHRDIEEARPLVEKAGNRSLDLALALVESESAQRQNDRDLAVRRVGEALDLIDRLEDPNETGRALRRCGMVHLLLGHASEADSLVSAAFAAYEAGGNTRGMAWARQSQAWISFLEGRLLEAEDRLAKASAAFEELGDSAGIAWSSGLLAYVRVYQGRFTEARELAERTLADAEERGDTWGQGMMLVALATSALWTGSIDEAVDRGEEALAFFRSATDPVGTIQARAVLGRALVRSGRIADGLRTLRGGGEDDPGDVGMAELLYTAGMAAAATIGDVAEGHRFGIGHGPQIVDPTVLGQSDRTVAAALIALQEGKVETASELLELLPPVGDPSGSTWSWAAAALVSAARVVDPGPVIAAISDSGRATYGDLALAWLADACWKAAAGEESATRAALERAEAVIPPGGDRIHPVVVAIARAACAVALGSTDANETRRHADALAGGIGMETTSWWTAFATVLSGGARGPIGPDVASG
jgi:class 3 adenylate cyclase/tetratricopeptide (TPR) repeat protein